MTTSSVEGRRVFVFGIDGATLDLITPWVDQGELPAFGKLMREGAYGRLQSTVPPLTPPAWTSSFTGKNPGKHNIFDFFKYAPGNYEKRIVSARDRKCKAIWNIASEQGKEVGVLNVPITFPPEKVNGFMVTGMLTPSLESDFTYPRWLKDELLRAVDYKIGIDLKKLVKGEDEAFLKDVMYVTQRRGKALFYLQEKFACDLFIAVFTTLDPLQHFFWKSIDENHPQPPGPEENQPQGAIVKHYKQLDELIGNLWDASGEDAVLIVFSDHGFGPLYKDVFVNNWLREQGFLKLRWNLQGLKWRSMKWRGFLPRRIRESINVDRHSESKLMSATDWKSTKAYFSSLSGQSIRINLQGREPGGIIEPGVAYEALRDRLIDEFHGLKDVETDEKLVEKVFKREEVYSGDYVHNAPDLLVEMREGYTLQEGFGEELIMPAKQSGAFRSGDHRGHGVIFIRGRGVRRGVLMKSPHIADVAPTILYLMGISVPADMDGRVLTEAFEGDYRDENPVHYGGEAPDYGDMDYEFSRDDAEELEDRLRGLGYLD